MNQNWIEEKMSDHKLIVLNLVMDAMLNSVAQEHLVMLMCA